jgi:hypothetical protein
MSDILIAPKYDLTKDDLKLIESVCKETAAAGGPIALVRGPETMELLKPWFPSNGGWAKLQKLGTIRTNGVASQTRNARPSNRFQKRVEYMFVGSKKWPNGIPVGTTDVYTQEAMGEDKYALSTSTADMTWDELERLRFASMGKRKMTQREIQEDSDRKEAIRSRRAEIEATTTPEERAAAASAAAIEKAFERLMAKQSGGTPK